MNQRPNLIVTGSGSGIGRAATLRLLEAGYRVIGISRRASRFVHPGFQAIDMDMAKLNDF